MVDTDKFLPIFVSAVLFSVVSLQVVHHIEGNIEPWGQYLETNEKEQS